MYRIIKDNKIAQLEEEINCLLESGWAVHGHVSAVYNGKEIIFMQVVMKENGSKKKTRPNAEADRAAEDEG